MTRLINIGNKSSDFRRALLKISKPCRIQLLCDGEDCTIEIVQPYEFGQEFRDGCGLNLDTLVKAFALDDPQYSCVQAIIIPAGSFADSSGTW